MWQRIRSRVARLNVSAKSLAGLWVALTFLYVENERFHDFVFGLFSRFPHFMQEIVVGLALPIMLMLGQWYKTKDDAK